MTNSPKDFNSIEELESFFKSQKKYPSSIRLNAYTTITDVEAFIRSHISYVKANQHKKYCSNYLDRLVFVKDILVKINSHPS